MECEEIKKIIPQYFQHTASDEEIQAVEEHLCVCHDCRTLLGELMDKASSAEEAAETPPEEKPQEEVEEKKEEEVQPEQSPEQSEGQSPESSEGEKDIEYFPGENLEASMDKIDEILGESEPAKGESGKEPQELEPTLEEKTDEEDSSFEVISDIPSAPKQELPAESDALDWKEPEPVKEEFKEPEEKLEVSSEEKEEKPETHWESGLELEEEKPEEPVKEPILEEEDVQLGQSPEQSEGQSPEQSEGQSPEQSEGQSLESGEGEVSKSDRRKSSRDKVSKGSESEREKESLEEVSYTLDRPPLEKGKIGLLECFCLFGGLAVLGFLAYLLLKG